MKKYIGTPHKLLGEDINDGLDCFTLIRDIYNDLDILFPQKYEFTEHCWTDGIEKEIEHHDDWKRVKNLKFGDLLILEQNGIIDHCGIYLDEGEFIHTMERTGCVVTNINHRLWKKKIKRIFRYIG